MEAQTGGDRDADKGQGNVAGRLCEGAGDGFHYSVQGEKWTSKPALDGAESQGRTGDPEEKPPPGHRTSRCPVESESQHADAEVVSASCSGRRRVVDVGFAQISLPYRFLSLHNYILINYLLD